MRLVVRPLAEADTDAAADYLAGEGGMDLALRFLDAVERAYGRLVEYPRIGAEVHAFASRLPGLRFWPVPTFERFLVFYRVLSDAVEIVGVVHGSRDLAELLG